VQITGFDGSPDAIDAIERGELRATALQPAVLISRLAVDEADRFLKTGSTGQPEVQDHSLRTGHKSNADNFRNFEKVR
jgi:erythritol transport system substrate-binding protein